MTLRARRRRRRRRGRRVPSARLGRRKKITPKAASPLSDCPPAARSAGQGWRRPRPRQGEGVPLGLLLPSCCHGRGPTLGFLLPSCCLLLPPVADPRAPDSTLPSLPSPRPPPIRSSLRKPAQACAWLRKPSDEGRAGRGAAARQPTYFIVADVSRRRPRARMAHATSARRLKTSPCGCANPVLRALASSRLLVRAPIVHLQGATRRAAACCVCSKAVRLHMAHVQLDGSSTLIHRSWLGMCTSVPTRCACRSIHPWACLRTSEPSDGAV